MREALRVNLKKYLVVLLCIFFLCLLLLSPQYSMKGVKNGLLICINKIVPSLFPFCVLSSFLVNSDIIKLLSVLISPLMKALRLPKICSGVVLLSFTGGYPVGAITADSLYEKGEITKDEYRRMMMFCVNAGPAFVIGTVGNGIFASTKAGIIIFLSLTLSGIITGILSGFTAQGDSSKENHGSDKIYTLNEALVNAVSTGTNTIINVCAWIVLFSCMLEFINALNISQFFKDFLFSMCEVTRGCIVSKNYKNIPLTSFILCFAGLSVHLQIFKFINKSGLKYMHFLCSRIVNAGLSSIISFLILKLFPLTQDVFGSIVNPLPKLCSVSIVSAVSMVIMGISLILELDRLLRKC